MKKKTLNQIIEGHIYKNWYVILGTSFCFDTKGKPFIAKGLKAVLKQNAKITANKIVEEVKREVNKMLDTANKI